MLGQDRLKAGKSPAGALAQNSPTLLRAYWQTECLRPRAPCCIIVTSSTVSAMGDILACGLCLRRPAIKLL